MSSEKIKCTQCNIVINELLCFVQNKIDIMDEESLIRIAISAFSAAEITSAKDLLFESLTTNTRNISRRKNKEQKDMEDIICVFKNTEPDNTPIFVARELEKLPPISFDHVDVTALLKDIVILKTEIKHLKESSVTVEQLNTVKAEIDHMKFASIIGPERTSCSTTFVNRKRGAYLLNSRCDSGPSGILNISNRSCNDDLDYNATLDSRSPSPPLRRNGKADGTTAAANECDRTSFRCQPSDCERNDQLTGGESKPLSTKPPAPNQLSKEINSEHPNDAFCENMSKTLADITRGGVWTKENPNEDWIKVQRYKLRNRYSSDSEGYARGRAAYRPEDKFKPANRLIPLFLSNVHKDTSETDIVDYIFSKTNEKVILHKIKMKSEKEYSAFKMMVSNTKLDKFLSDELWPSDITCRRFRPYIRRTS